jgi:hypothetical protein
MKRLAILLIWLMQEGTNLSRNEVKSFEEVGFIFNKRQPILLESLFIGENFILIN